MIWTHVIGMFIASIFLILIYFFVKSRLKNTIRNNIREFKIDVRDETSDYFSKMTDCFHDIWEDQKIYIDCHLDELKDIIKPKSPRKKPLQIRKVGVLRKTKKIR